MTPQYRLDALVPGDAEEVQRIYREGIATGNSTFEADAPSWNKWDEGHLAAPRLVARQQRRILGWAVLSPVSSRCVYRGVAEVSVYVSAEARGRSVGKTLLLGLIDAAEGAGIWTLQAGVFPENTPSLALVERCGFKVVGVRERIGKMTFGPMAGAWRDVVLLERRSRVAGVD